MSVVLLLASGLYASLLHLQDPPTFVASPYGRALAVKLGLVSMIVGLAGVNRFWLLPRFVARGADGLRTALRVELLLLAAVFVATGVLTTSPLPHSGEASSVLTSVRSLWIYLMTR